MDAATHLGTTAGQLLARAIDTDFALSKRVHLSLAEIPADEWLVLKMLEDERGRIQVEEDLTASKVSYA